MHPLPADYSVNIVSNLTMTTCTTPQNDDTKLITYPNNLPSQWLAAFANQQDACIYQPHTPFRQLKPRGSSRIGEMELMRIDDRIMCTTANKSGSKRSELECHRMSSAECTALHSRHASRNLGPRVLCRFILSITIYLSPPVYRHHGRVTLPLSRSTIPRASF